MKVWSIFILCFIMAAASAGFDWKKAEKEIKFLKPDKNIPEKVRKAIKDQGCSIPQSSFNKKPHNIIKGSFADKNSKDWAVLCSKEGKSSIFVIWQKRTPCPTSFAANEDKTYLQSVDKNQIGYSRIITAASKEVILKHQKSYGGPLPKRLSHQGIDDAFAEKGSVTYFCEGGKWLALQGAD